MAIIRYFGLFVFLLALISMAVDATKTLASEEVIITSFEEFWLKSHPQSYTGLQSFFEAYLPEFIRDSVLDFLFSLPVWLFLALIGVLLYWLGRKRVKTSVYIN